MNPSDEVRIRHMIQAGETALRFVADRQLADLERDEMLRFALIRAVEMIGEAASRISAETRAESASVPWADAVLMRNRLIHAYFNIDHTVLWKTAKEDIPALLDQLRLLLPSG